MSPNLRSNAGPLLLMTGLAMALLAGGALAKTSDRNQEMSLDAGYQDGNVTQDGVIHLDQGVHLTQGTLDIQATKGQIVRKNGEITQVTFTGGPVKMKQINDDGTPMNAQADMIVYDLMKEIITLTGDYTVTSPKGSNSGQKMVYNTKTGNMQSGGDGSRVHTVIQPKNKSPGATVGSPTQVPPAKPGNK